MFRAFVLTVAFGLTPAFAEDSLILDGLPSCDGTCPETTVTAMSSDIDGDGAAEYFEIYDPEAELAVAEAECAADLLEEAIESCTAPVYGVAGEAAQL